MPTPHLTNWSGNLTYSSSSLLTPTTLDDLLTLLRTHPHLKPLGTRHCFNTLADTTGPHISLAAFNHIAIDTAAHTVTVGAGVTYGQLTPVLHAQGFALHNLASLPHISIAGAIATATHGSGSANGNLATAVSALDLLTPAGRLLHLSRTTHPDIFPACIVALGALGIVTSLTLDLQPAFTIAQSVYENLPFAALEHHLEDIFAAAYSVSLFTDWQSGLAHQAWVKSLIESTTSESGSSTPAPPPDSTFFGAPLQTHPLHPLPNQPATHCTPQLGLPGPSHERLPHFRLDFTPSVGAELQSEYFVPLAHAVPALRAVESLRAHLAPHLFVSELRTIASDDLWLSPCYHRPSLAIHFTWRPHQPEVLALLPLIESALAPFAARPHWGKLFTTPAETLATLYPRLPDFRRLQSLHDPTCQLRNPFLTHIGL